MTAQPPRGPGPASDVRRAWALGVARVATVALMGLLPVSTAAAAVCMALMVLGWLVAGGLRPTLELLRREPALALAIALFAWLAASLAWTPAPMDDALAALGKYRKLLLVPIACWLLASASWRRHALLAFAVAMLVTLAGSYASAAGLFVWPAQVRFGLPGNHVVFKPHITQGWMMSLFAFGMLVLAGRAGSRWRRTAFAILGVLAVLDVLLLTKGRTGYITMFALLAAWLLLQVGWRRLIVPVVAVPLLLGGLLGIDNPFRQRVLETVEDLRQMDRRPERVGSTELRYTFVLNSIELIARAPVVGHGLGSTLTVHQPLARQRSGSAGQAMFNPHNEYLNLAIQGGAVALALWVALLVALARRAARLHGVARRLAAGLLVLMAVGCLVNSSLVDFAEGHLLVVAAGLLVATARGGREPAGSHFSEPAGIGTGGPPGDPRRLEGLSAVLIARNEAHRIRACLDALSFAEEIVVLVDADSTDETAELARACGARVSVAPDWPGFGAQKNRALALARGPWVLSIDADEIVTPALRDSIAAALDRRDAPPGWWVRRRSTFCGRPVRFGDWGRDRVLRLFRKDVARFSDDRVHESVLCPPPHGMLDGVLLHHTVDSLADARDKTLRYARLGAEKLRARGRGGPVSAAAHAAWSFVRGYVLRGGFLDGWAGWQVARLAAWGTWLRYSMAGAARVRKG